MKVIVIRFRRLTLKVTLLGLAFLAILVLLARVPVPQLKNVFSQKRQLPIYSVDVSEKMVALTFDCAWGASDIPTILEELEKEEVKATFFIVGQWAEKYPDAVMQIAKAGHDIGNHSYSHLRMGALDAGKVKSEIELCGKKLSEITGKPVDLFRPPYGDYNNTVITTAEALGYYTIQWDVDSLDWKPGISREEIMNRILSRVRPGSILLFHNDTPHTAAVLPDIIRALKKAEYKFIPVSRMIYRDDYTIDFTGRQMKKKE